METLKVQMNPEKAARVRTYAIQLYGPKKGAVSKAMNDVIDEWLQRLEVRRKGEAPNFRKFAGALQDIKMTSVELQHAITRMRAKG